jgi:DNA-binding NarL/FixJ family response regulator
MIDKINLKMNLTEKERLILQLAKQGLSDYRIARKINSDPPSITRSRKNAHKKLIDAFKDIEWASRMGVNISELDQTPQLYSFFL